MINPYLKCIVHPKPCNHPIPLTTKGFRWYNLVSKKILLMQHVTIDELKILVI